MLVDICHPILFARTGLAAACRKQIINRATHARVRNVPFLPRHFPETTAMNPQINEFLRRSCELRDRAEALNGRAPTDEPTDETTPVSQNDAPPSAPAETPPDQAETPVDVPNPAMHPSALSPLPHGLPSLKCRIIKSHPSLPQVDPDAFQDEDIPYWIPEGPALEKWPEPIRRDVVNLLRPIYEDLVLDARNGLARSIGVSIVYMLWLEILEQLDVTRKVRVHDPNHTDQFRALGLEQRVTTIDRYLHIVNAKFKATDLLLRLETILDRRRAERRRSAHQRNLRDDARHPRRIGKK